MRLIKPAALTAALLLGALLCADAWAQQQAEKQTERPVSARQLEPPSAEDYARLPVCTLSADGKRLAVEPCRTAPAMVPMPRRPVPQIIQRMPRSTQAPQVAMPAMPPSRPIKSLLRPPGTPMPAVGCDAGGCYDPSGVRHNNAAGGSTLTPGGKLCNRTGPWIQC